MSISESSLELDRYRQLDPQNYAACSYKRPGSATGHGCCKKKQSIGGHYVAGGVLAGQRSCTDRAISGHRKVSPAAHVWAGQETETAMPLSSASKAGFVRAALRADRQRVRRLCQGICCLRNYTVYRLLVSLVCMYDCFLYHN